MKHIKLSLDVHSKRWWVSILGAIGLLITAFIPNFDVNHYNELTTLVLTLMTSIGLLTDTSKSKGDF